MKFERIIDIIIYIVIYNNNINELNFSKLSFVICHPQVDKTSLPCLASGEK